MRTFVRILSLGLFTLGLLATYNLCKPMQDRIYPVFFQSLIFLGPGILVAGLFFVWKTFSTSSPGSTKKYRSIYFVMILGIVLVVIGAYPWMYTSHIVGGQPGNEAAGMLGTIIFILIGIPGIVLTLIAVIYSFVLWFKKGSSHSSSSEAEINVERSE